MTHLPVIHLPAVRLEVIRLLVVRLQEEMIRLPVEGQSPVEEQVLVEVAQPPEEALRPPDKKNQAEVEQANLH
tara:strand:- start:281 stop:499 length:219 start_codon:yes stop_codon:yes gene_type:complete